MNSIKAIPRQRLGCTFGLPTALALMGRLSLALGIAATVVASALGPPAAPGAAAEPPGPVNRLQIVVNKIFVNDDREGRFSGAGEMAFSASIWICNEVAFPECEIDNGHVTHGSMMASIDNHFNASTGDTVTLDRLVPGDGYVMTGGQVNEKVGFPVFAGQQYVVMFHMVESDGSWTSSEDMGSWFQRIDTGVNGVGIGSHTERSRRADGIHVGDFTITYEVRLTSLPDLRGSGIRVLDVPGSARKRVCIGVQNVGGADAGPFDVSLYVENTMPAGGSTRVERLASVNGGEYCVEVDLPSAGRWHLRAVIDQFHAVDESDDSNNTVESVYDGPLPLPSPTTQAQTKSPTEATSKPSSASAGPATLPAPGAAQADLTIGAIKVNGQVPDGKDDCKDGKNTVSVVVKNAGAAEAGAFTVRLAVDDAQSDAVEKSVSGLEAGNEREVRFEDVRLKKGERILTAVADGKGAVAESKDDNNERQVTARCKDAA